MSNNIDEVIVHCNNQADELKHIANKYDENDAWENNEKCACLKDATEFEHISEWLTELKQRREAERWVPVSERLPEKEGKCLVTTDFGDVCEDSFVDGIFVLYLGNVIAWRYKPEPYKENKADNKS